MARAHIPEQIPEPHRENEIRSKGYLPLRQDIREYLVEAASSLLSESRFLDAVPGLVLDDGRVPLILERLNQLTKLNA